MCTYVLYMYVVLDTSRDYMPSLEGRNVWRCHCCVNQDMRRRTLIFAMQVEKGGADMGFFGSAPPSRAAKLKQSNAISQDGASEPQAALPADSRQGQDTGPQAEASAAAEDRGRWGEQAQLPNRAVDGQAEEAEERGRWGEGSDSEAGQQGAAGKSTAALPAPVSLPLDVSVDRGEWRARQSLSGAPALMAALPPHLGVRLEFGSVHEERPSATGRAPEQNWAAKPGVSNSKQQPSGEPSSAAGRQPPPSQGDGEKAGTERRWSSEWPALGRREAKPGRRVEAALDRSGRSSRDRAGDSSERGRNGSRKPGPRERARERARGSDHGEHLRCCLPICNIIAI
jgi:hypothetical protein